MVEKNNKGEDILRVFVYGTLKAGGRLSGSVAGDRISSKAAIAKGSMFNVGGGAYPAVLFDGKSDVIGEVHEYVNAQKCLQSMDRIEGFSGEIKAMGEGNLYNRIEVEVDIDGEKVKCSTYEYNNSTSHMSQIPNGIWEI